MGLTIISFGGAVFFHCYWKIDFGFNISLAIFGSALLTYISALVAYKNAQRENIMMYLSDLRCYKRKYRRIQAAGADTRSWFIDDISDFFDELRCDYAQIQYLCKGCFIHKDISPKLDCSIQNIITVQEKINLASADFLQCQQIIDEAIELVENAAKEKKYLKMREDK